MERLKFLKTETLSTNGQSKGLEIATSDGCKDDPNEDDGDENAI